MPARRAALILILASCLLYGVALGRLDFWAPDEPRYGAIAEELRSFDHGLSGLVLLHLNDEPYTQKPPLYFWLAALSGAPGERVSEWAARLPSAIAGVGCVALTALLGRWLLGNPTLALLAAGLLATSFRFAFTARRAQLDVLLTVLELLAIVVFIHLEFIRNVLGSGRDTPGRTDGTPAVGRDRPQDPRPSRLAIAGLHTALGAAALVKGPVAWLPLAIIASYLAWEGRIRTFHAIAPVWAWSLSLGPIGLWMLAAIALAPPGFAELAVGENLIGRFFAGTSHARPFYYFLYQTPADFLPWTLLLPFGLFRIAQWARRPASRPRPHSAQEVSAARFILVWIGVPLLFFSLSAGKRGLYLLPIFPALSLVAALGVDCLDGTKTLDWRATRRAAMTLAIVAGLELLLFAVALPQLDAYKSPRPIAIAAARATRPDEAIGVYGLCPIEGAIAYYGDRRVASLQNEHELRSFLARGGSTILLRARHFEELGPALGLDRLERFRSGRRELVLASRSSASPNGAAAPKPAETGTKSP